MANASNDYGLVPYGTLSGGPIPTRVVDVASGTAALFVGDPVIPTGTGDIFGRLGVVIAVGSEGTESTNIYGVVVGFNPKGPDSLTTHAGATGAVRTAIVALAMPDVLFRVNASNTTGASPNDVGAGFDLVAGTGSSLTGRSGWALDMGEDTQAAATSGQVRLIAFDPRPDNTIGAAVSTDSPNVDCLVIFAESYFNNNSAGGVTS